MARPAPAPSDPPADPSELALRAFVRARSAGREDDMTRSWRHLITLEIARIRAYVSTNHSDALPQGGLTREERDEIVQETCVRVLRALNFEGRSIGELRAYLRTASGFAFQDFVRRHVAEDRHRAGSLDAESPDGEGPGAAAREAADLQARRALEADGPSISAVGLAAALAAVDENKRTVVLLKFDGFTAREIAARLGISEANVDQRFKRGLDQLREALGVDP